MKSQPGYVDPEYLKRLMALTFPLKERTYEWMALEPGFRVLDLGCGPGSDTIPMAKYVGRAGEVIGVDHDAEMIHIADQLAQEAGVGDFVRHLQGDAVRLSYADNYFDASRSERLLQHLEDPEAALVEMVRVTRPGGAIVVADTDHSSVSISNEQLDIEWKMRRIRADMFKNGYSGRDLYGLFQAQGLKDIQFELFPLAVTEYQLGRFVSLQDQVEEVGLAEGILTREEIQAFNKHLAELVAAGRYFAYGTMIVLRGVKA